MAERPQISIVINTDSRAASLATTLESLRWLDYPTYEVCVVYGPTPDGTEAVLSQWDGAIKIAKCLERNLSVSRNIGVAMAAGEIIAFLDDDAIPEPEWLLELAAAYNTPDVGGAGGFVYDSTGVVLQYRFATANRMAAADLSWTRPAPELNFPFSSNFPHLLGANSSFLRRALLGVGGFDEEYEYYLDETDLICRLVDAGWRLVQIEGAYVHHKFSSSALRNETKVVTDWYPIIKNKAYFSIVNGRAYAGMGEIIDALRAFVADAERSTEWAFSVGFITEEIRDRFRADADRAWTDGLTRGLTGCRRLGDFASLHRYAQPFLPFTRNVLRDGRRCLCLLSFEYPPGPVGGIGRYVQVLARALAATGHHVHVLTSGKEDSRVDFEEGVWVHRIASRPSEPPPIGGMHVPARPWYHAATMLEEVRKVARQRRVDIVIAPMWDAEGLAVMEDGELPLVTSLHTPLKVWLESEVARASDPDFMDNFALPMIAAETRLLERSEAILANSRAIMTEVATVYRVRFDERCAVVPHGIDDITRLPKRLPPPLPPGHMRLLFVGRIERRKGVDVLLSAVRRLFTRHTHLHLDLVGDASISDPRGMTLRAAFESDPETQPLRDRVVFHGSVEDEVLRGFYADCEIFVAPSRFESFGLILLEAMAFAKPVIASRAGGMMEVVQDSISGLLADPGDSASLEECLERLVLDSELRMQLGCAGRARYESCFTSKHMAEGVLRFVDQVIATRIGKAAMVQKC